jgi:hypothetical protein
VLQVSQPISQQLLFFLQHDRLPNSLLNRPPDFLLQQPLSQEGASQQVGSQQVLSHPQAGSQQAGSQQVGSQQVLSHPQAGSQLDAQPQAGPQADSQPQAGSQLVDSQQVLSHPQAGSQQEGASQHELELPQPFIPSIRSSRSKPKLWLQTELAKTIVNVRIVRFMEINLPL